MDGRAAVVLKPSATTAAFRCGIHELLLAIRPQSVLTPEDLERIPFTLLVKDCTVSFMAHKRSVVHICRRSAETIKEFYGDDPQQTDWFGRCINARAFTRLQGILDASKGNVYCGGGSDEGGGGDCDDDSREC